MSTLGRIIGLLLAAVGAIAVLGWLMMLGDERIAGETVLAGVLACFMVIGVGSGLYMLGEVVDHLAAIRTQKSVAIEEPTVAESQPGWLVIGKDGKGREHRFRVDCDSREAAFAEASKRGIVQAHSIERA